MTTQPTPSFTRVLWRLARAQPWRYGLAVALWTAIWTMPVIPGLIIAFFFDRLVEGISVSTLSVETSSKGSSTSTESPTDFSQRVTVPSVTDSPRAGSVTSLLMMGIVSDISRGREAACRPGPGGPRPSPHSGWGGRG